MKNNIKIKIFLSVVFVFVLTLVACGGDPEPPHTHSFSAWETITEATCARNGLLERSCSCGAVEKEIIPANTEHTLGDWEIVSEANCGVAGKRVQICSVCENEINSEEIPATGEHSGFSWILTEDKKYKEYTCGVCGYVQKRVQNMSGGGGGGGGSTPPPHSHSYNNWVITTPASCTVDGVETATCSCGNKKTRPITATGHSGEKGKEIVSVEQFRCTEFGIISYAGECEKCKETYTWKEKTDPLMHSWCKSESGKNYCGICGYQNDSGVNGKIILEDTSAIYGDEAFYVASYYNPDKITFTYKISIILANGEERNLSKINCIDIPDSDASAVLVPIDEVEAAAAVITSDSYKVKITFVTTTDSYSLIFGDGFVANGIEEGGKYLAAFFFNDGYINEESARRFIIKPNQTAYWTIKSDSMGVGDGNWFVRLVDSNGVELFEEFISGKTNGYKEHKLEAGKIYYLDVILESTGYCENIGFECTTSSTQQHTHIGAENPTCMISSVCYICDSQFFADHKWVEATCVSPAYCELCDKTGDTLADHNWVDATCNMPMHCTVCLKMIGEPLEHNYRGGICLICGREED